MLYNAHFALKFGWISMIIERVIHDSRKVFENLSSHPQGKTGGRGGEHGGRGAIAPALCEVGGGGAAPLHFLAN